MPNFEKLTADLNPPQARNYADYMEQLRDIPRTPDGKLDHEGVARALKVVTATGELMTKAEKKERRFRKKEDFALWAQEELGMSEEKAKEFAEKRVKESFAADDQGNAYLNWVHDGSLIIGREGKVNNIQTFPFHRVKGSLLMLYVDDVELPADLIVEGSLDISNSHITRLPDGLQVGKSFKAEYSTLQAIGANSRFGDVNQEMNQPSRDSLNFLINNCPDLKIIPHDCLIDVGELRYDKENTELKNSIEAGKVEGRIKFDIG